MEDEATQAATQHQFDPRRVGRNGSGLNESDVSDVICILHPASPAAFRIVSHTARSNAQHVLQNPTVNVINNGKDLQSSTELETLLIESFPENQALDLALRFSSNVFDPAVGFCFGRNLMKCDINLDAENKQKRVSNTHFRIFVNSQGVLMLEDLSLNGTIVDHNVLGGKRRTGNNTMPKGPKTRTLDSGSVIEILSDDPDVSIKFVLRIPPREGFEQAYIAKFQAYMAHVAVAEERANAAKMGPPIPEAAARGLLAAPLAGPPNPKSIPTLHPPNLNSDYGMHWSGGETYKCTGVLGKGAFATVYQLATRLNGELFAAKELDKKRFVRNGVLDQRLDNEMQIMQALRHPNIVQYIEYVETSQYLYIIMEYIQCGDLQGYMQAHGTLAEHLARSMTIQILRALAYLHSKNITHRDIKPDNILICSEDPFVVKLTDFGLSKVVKNNDTFLKTFCGTLLYCAPEVFPHYDTYVAGNRSKRRRRGDIPQSNQRSYSQQVDIWSFAAVLWFVLCGKPPFEGVVDGNGKGMFNRIMETPLDTSPLMDHGISEPCIDLLKQMLNTDPATRPDEAACLQHPWLSEESGHVKVGVQRGLAPIAEREELDASQLSINDQSGNPGTNHAVDSQHSNGSVEHGDIKRQKGQSFLEHRGTTGLPSSSDSLDSIPMIKDIYEGQTQPAPPTKPQRLFGEISQTALKSSGVLGAHLNLAFDESRESTEPKSEGGVENHSHQAQAGEVDPELRQESSGQADQAWMPPPAVRANASWRESMVRELNMTSPTAGNSAVHEPHEPSTPTSPNDHKGQPGQRHDDAQHHVAYDGETQLPTDLDEETPKPKQSSFSRQISIPVSASFFYDPSDPSTHNPEYASRISGINFLDESSSNNIALNSLPETVVASFRSYGKPTTESTAAPQSQNKENENNESLLLPAPDFRLLTIDNRPSMDESSASAAAATASEFLKPPRVLGKLTSVPGSFVSMTINLTQRVTTWGRHPGNTVVYRDSQDTRIPKVALEIYFHAKGIDNALGVTQDDDGGSAAEDFTKMDNFNVFVATQSRRGISVNGVTMLEKDEQGRRCFGRLYTGDEICVSQSEHGERLKFLCEFFIGKGRKARRGGSRFVVETVTAEAGPQ